MAMAARHDPMAAAVESHSRAIDPQDVVAEELHLRAQANRVAADLHTRDAETLEREAGADDGARLQAAAHRESASEHEREAQRLGQRGSHDDERPAA